MHALSEDFRQELRRRSDRLTYENGALEAARAIEQLVFSVRANAPLHESIAKAVGRPIDSLLHLPEDKFIEAKSEFDLVLRNSILRQSATSVGGHSAHIRRW